MSGESKEDKFDRMWKRADEMIERFDKLFSSFPDPDFKGFFNRTVTYYDTNPEEEEFEPANDPMEYKLVKPPTGGFNGKEAIEKWLNGYGAEGWGLNCFEFGYAVFSRFAEDEDEENAEE
jgi:hypothetical protein